MAHSTASLASSQTRVDRTERPLSVHGIEDVEGVEDVEKGIQGREALRLSSEASKLRHGPEPEPALEPGPDQDEEASAAGPGRGAKEGDYDLYQPKNLKFWLILVSNFLALFLVALDRTIVATAIPRITDEFKSLGDVGWYGSAYMLTTSASQLVFGRVYKYYNMKWVFLGCVIVFEIGSAICGAAPNSTVFIVGRAIAGLASAGIFSGTMLIMIPMIPLHRRPMFQGMFGMVFGISSVMGPLVGGGLTGGVTWRWCFYINLPIGAFTLLFMLFFWNPPYRQREPASVFTHIKRLDPLGTFFLVPSVVSLLLALQWGGSTYDWSDWRIIMLFCIFGVLGLAFAAVQNLLPETATIPGRVISQRSVFFGMWFTFFLAGSMLMLVYYLPIWFQTVQEVDPLRSGIYTLPLVLSLVVSSMMSGLATQRIGYYVPSMLLAPCIMSVGEGLMSTFDLSTGSSHWIAYQFLAGFGLGMGMQTSGLAVQTVLPMSDVSTGIAIIFFSQQLGGAIFTTVGQTILSNILVQRLSAIPNVDASAVVENGATDLVDLVPPEDMGLVVNAYNYACTRIFLAAMGSSFAALVCACGMQWRSIKRGRQHHVTASSDSSSPASSRPGSSTTDTAPAVPDHDGKVVEGGSEDNEDKEKTSRPDSTALTLLEAGQEGTETTPEGAEKCELEVRRNRTGNEEDTREDDAEKDWGRQEQKHQGY